MDSPMKTKLVALTFSCLLASLAAAPLVEHGSELHPNLEQPADSESLIELTHWTAKGLLELGVDETSTAKNAVELAAEDVTVQEALSGNSRMSQSAVVIVTGQDPPRRRKEDQPFVSVVSSDADIAMNATSSLPVTMLNQAITFWESISGRRVYPFRLIASTAPNLNTGHAPYVIYDVSRGDVHISTRLVQSLTNFPEQLETTLHDLLYKVVASFQVDGLKNATSNPTSKMEQLFKAATELIGSGIIATAISSPPVWFCFVCPIVLGEFFPFFFNLGLGKIAEIICERYHLDDAECLDLWLGAVALALVLSLSSVIAIVSICRIRECAKPRIS